MIYTKEKVQTLNVLIYSLFSGVRPKIGQKPDLELAILCWKQIGKARWAQLHLIILEKCP